MKSKIYIGIGVLMLLAGAFVKGKSLTIGGTVFVLLGLFLLVAVSSGIEFSESHYRFYKRIFFWRTGHWKSILGVRRIYIRHYTATKTSSFLGSSPIPLEEQTIEYQVFFVRKSGYYKIFHTNSLKAAREKAIGLATKYNLVVKEKEKVEEKQEVKKVEVQQTLRAEKHFIPLEEMASAH